MITQIVPSLPPARDGVGDYTCRLFETWDDPSPFWSFIVRRGAEESRSLNPGWKISECAADAPGLLASLEEHDTTDVVLQYAGYGYHARGIPVWLVAGLTRWKEGDATRRLTVMFHELYAQTGPLQSAFWLKPLAKSVVSRLVQLADHSVTSCGEYHDRLLREFHSDPAKTHRISIGPNISPEPGTPTDRPWPLSAGGKLRLLLFGMATTRLWALEAHAELVQTLHAKNLIESITLLGKSGFGPKHAKRFETLRRKVAPDGLWKEHYDLAPEPLSRLVLEQDLGLVSNWPGILTKSGVFAVLAAHGVPAVIAKKGPHPSNLPDAFFENDDSPASIATCLSEFHDAALVARKRHTLAQFHDSELRWDRVAGKWYALLHSTTAHVDS